MQFQWYPGHMTKAKRQMQEDIKLVDLVIELVDARIPVSSRNPDIDTLGKGKARLILLNKSDLADERKNEGWTEFFKKKGYYVVRMDARNKGSMKQVSAIIAEACKEKTERDLRRGIKNRPVRAMVVGIPNVGKSTFINTFAGKACAKTGNKPGVTKGKQWIRLNKNVELLDTPGILWPKFEDQSVGLRLALIGSIKDDILNIDELSLELIQILREEYPGVLKERYGMEEEGTPAEMLEKIALNRGCIKKGNEVDYDKAAALVLDEFRTGKLGKISLEKPEVEAYDKNKNRNQKELEQDGDMKEEEHGKRGKAVRESVSFILYLIVIVVLTFLMIRYVGQRTRVDGSSMENTLTNGDNLIVDKISYRFHEPERFDIIVFPYQYKEDTYFIKRIIGMPGETVQITDKGEILINGEELVESYGREVIKDPGLASDPITLGEDEYFVMGDNRNYSKDSRFPDVGNIRRADIIGKAWLRIYPFDKIGFIRHQ